MESRLDQVIEELETTNQKVNKMNFEIEGLKDEIDRLEEKQPFMVRHIQKNKKKLMKVMKESYELNMKNNKLNEEYAKLKAEVDEKAKIEEKPTKSDD